MKVIEANNVKIGLGQPCFIVAEIGINHNGQLDMAKNMIDTAVKCGADAVKFQKFKAEEFISDPKETYTYRSQGKEVTESMLTMFKRYEFKTDDWIEIFKYCQKKKIIFFAAAQNPSDLDFLLEYTDMPLIKVGSDDLTNLELLSYYASKRKPMIISAGMAYLSEIEDAVNTIRGQKNSDIAVLHCVASYPADTEELNLRKMLAIRNKFDVVSGFSDHSVGNTAATAAVALGASIIEKHFTLDKNLPGPDHWFSADAKEFTEMVSSVRYVERALGSEAIEPTQKELGMRQIARRSIVAAVNIPAGRQIAEKDIAFKKPGTGLAPKQKPLLLGKKAKKDIQKDEQIRLEDVI